MKNPMDQEDQLCNIIKWRAKRRPERTVALGDSLARLFEKRISPKQARFEPIAQAWSQLLPAELAEHCRIAGIDGGKLRVKVDSPAYMHELGLCSSQLLEQLQQLCPRASVREIKLSIG